MGYCELIPIKDGTPQNGLEFRNPWRGAARIWDALYDRYLKNPDIPYDSWLTSYRKDEGKALWDLAKRPDLPMFERAVHAFTFDLAYVRRENYPRIAADLRAFDLAYPADYPSHLSAWADAIEGLDADAVGMYATSVSRNPWWEYDEEQDEATPHSIEDGFEIYDWLELTAAATPARTGPDGKGEAAPQQHGPDAPTAWYVRADDSRREATLFFGHDGNSLTLSADMHGVLLSICAAHNHDRASR